MLRPLWPMCRAEELLRREFAEVVEIVVVDPSSLGHRPPVWPFDLEHLPFGVLVAKRVVIDFVVVAADGEVARPARHGQLEYVAGDAAMMNAGFEPHFACLVREDKSLNHDIGGRAFQAETGVARDFRAANRFSRNDDRLFACSNGGDGDRTAGNVPAIGDDDVVAGRCRGDGFFERRQRIDLDNRCRQLSRHSQ